jgi:hypothetical protein
MVDTIVSERVAELVDERARSQDVVSSWRAFLSSYESTLAKIIEARANVIQASVVNSITATGRLPVKFVSDIADLATVAVMAVVAGANEQGLISMGIDYVTKSGGADTEYRTWLSGTYPDKYYDPEFMGEVAGSSDDWQEAVRAHSEYRKRQSNVKSRREIVSLLPPVDAPPKVTELPGVELERDVPVLVQ